MSNAKKTVGALFSLADIRINGARDWDITVHNTQFYHRILKEGALGLGESYMDGWWETKALDEMINRLLRADLHNKIKKNWKLVCQTLAAKLFNRQNIKRSKKVANIHYNLDNTLYEKMLGPSMAYTCAYYKNTADLDAAQTAKYDLVCQKLQLKPGERVLELGCGWGGLAKHAAKQYGVEITSINIAEEQVKFAKQLCEGLPVTFHLTDYRNDHEYNPDQKLFDKIVSVGLCEHIGHKNYHTFMQVAHRNLKPQGLFLLHTIGSNVSVPRANTWISKYIFPGGMLPSEKQLSEAHEPYFIMEDWHNFGAYYDKTLMAWYKNFIANWHSLKHRYDARFFRMWSYYLLACAGMFRARQAQLWQVILSKGAVNGVYPCVR